MDRPMVDAYYPFIDIAVHEKVRAHYAAGDALALFSSGMERALWANGAGAALFGFSSVYDFIEQGPDRLSVFFRQFQASAGRLREPGDSRNFLIRAASGFRSTTVNATAEVITLADGATALLLSTPAATTDAAPASRAQQMLAGLDDPYTHMAVLDADGVLVAASSGFEALGVTPQTARTLVALAASDIAGLVKRPIPTLRGYLPAAVARVSNDLNLILTVEPETGDGQQGHDVADPAALTEVVPVTEIAPVAEGPVSTPEFSAPASEPFVLPDYQATLAAIAKIEEIETQPAEGEDDHTIDAADAPVEMAEAPALALNEEAPVEPVEDTLATFAQTAVSSFLFDPARRTFRFVWKTDAEGRFSDISGEFAEAVGPHAADVKGQSFAALAERYGLDADGKVIEALARRDTWSGKTVYWPVEGSRLKVPVDLAALPAYDRSREFDGFRGFGIVRPGDAVEDANGIGLTIGVPDVATEETQAEPVPTIEETTPEPVASEGHGTIETGDLTDEGEAQAPVPEEPFLSAPADEATENLHPDGTETEAILEMADDLGPADDLDAEATAEEATPADLLPAKSDLEQTIDAIDPSEWPEGEPPALRFAEPPAPPQSDKVISLEQHRAKAFESLTPGEQAAFREIGRKLESFRQADEPAETTAEEPQVVAEDDVAAVTDAPAPTIEDAEPEETMAEPVAADDIIEAPAAPAGGLTPAVLAQMPVALLVLAGDVLYHANPEFLRLTGYADLDAVRDVGGLDALLQRGDLSGKELAPGAMMVVRADDEIVPVTAKLQSVRWEGTTALMLALMPLDAGQAAKIDPPAPVATVAADTTATELAQLRVEADELRSILETATDGVVILSHDGEIRSMNRSASALFNYDNDETRGKPFVMLFAHESQRAVADYLSGLSGNGVMSVLNDGREVIGREASGGFLPLFMTIGRLTSSNGYCAVMRDITQWKRSEEELRNAKRAAETANAHKTDFLARVSHEIRTPLNAIIGFSDLLASEHFGPIGHPRYVEYANDIGRSGRHVLDIVNDLLDISKIEAGEMDLEFTAVSLNETIAEAVSLVQPQANGQRVIIRTALSQSVPAVVADLRSIKQIVLNILANSIRFTPSGGQIVVSTSYEANGGVSLRIRDTGIGMTRAELEQAMKPFRQVTSGQQKRGEGTGLGLPLTKAMTEANRAAFVIQSSPNEGTLVEILFPPQRVLAN